MSRRVLSALALGLVLVVGTGCGVNGTNFRPGVAAQVGDERIYVDDVDEVVSGYCSFLADRGSDDPPSTRSFLHSAVLQVLLERTAVEDLLSERGLNPDPVYSQAVAQISRDAGGLDDEEAAAYRTANEAFSYVSYGVIALGGDELDDPSIPALRADTDPRTDPRYLPGLEVVANWFADQDLEVNPRYGFDSEVSIDDETRQLTFGVADETSVASSARARKAENPDEAYVASLPDNQTCG